MPLGNQYGIDLGNIYETASSLKTAKQLREQREKKSKEEDVAATAEKEFLQKERPGTTATSIAQQSEFDKLDNDTKATRLAEARKVVERHGKVALFASTLPIDQQGPYIQQYVTTLPEEEQTAFNQKYTGDLTQQIPHMINDLMTTDQLLKEREARLKHDAALEEIGVKGATQAGIEDIKQKGQTERTNILAGSREKIAEKRQTGQGGRASSKPKLLSYEIKTKTDPKTGDKTTVRINKYDDGTITTTEGGSALKPPPPLTKEKKKPLDINKYMK